MSPEIDSFEQWARQADAMQAHMMEARSKLLEAEVTATSGRVTLTLGASGRLCDIRIDRETVHDIAELRREILAAHERASTAIQQLAEDMMQPVKDLVGRLNGLDQ